MVGQSPSARTVSMLLRLLVFLPAVLGPCALAETNAPPGSVEAPAAAAEADVSELPPVVVSASPTPNSLFDLAQPVTVLEGEHLRNRLAPTLGETLGREPGIHSTYYGPNASRPVIRGLDGDHIRLLQNGVGTMDVSATSVDHAVSQDPLTMTRIEVVRGAAALLYGPTAVGGVVNVMDNRIPDARIDEPLTGRVEGRYTSPDNGTSGALLVEIQLPH
jgi:iron complex outermembrane recepter protein